MSKATQKPRPRRDNYWEHTRWPLHSLVIVAPLLLIFHVLELRYDSNLLAPSLVLRFLHYLGATQAFLPPLLIAVVLLLLHAARKDPWQIKPVALVGMVGESIFWTIPLVGLSELTGRLSAAIDVDAVLEPTLIAVGAGVYEEFVFRLVLISLVVLLFSDVLGLRRDVVTIAAVVCGAAIFGLCHFQWAQITGRAPLPWGRFLFFTVAGVLWGGLLLFRGFAVAVGCHIVWDLYALAMRE